MLGEVWVEPHCSFGFLRLILPVAGMRQALSHNAASLGTTEDTSLSDGLPHLPRIDAG